MSAGFYGENPQFVAAKAAAQAEVNRLANLCHDWLIAQPHSYVGEAPPELTRPLYDAEERLADLCRRETDRYLAAVRSGTIAG